MSDTGVTITLWDETGDFPVETVIDWQDAAHRIAGLICLDVPPSADEYARAHRILRTIFSLDQPATAPAEKEQS